MTRRSGRIEEGTVVLIRLPEKTFLAKIIYSSDIFKDVILLAVYLHREDITLEVALSGEPAALLYSGGACIGSDGWKKVGSQPISAAEHEKSRRIVGGEVWVGDIEVGPATPEDWAQLPTMDVWGCVGVAHRLRELLP